MLPTNRGFYVYFPQISQELNEEKFEVVQKEPCLIKKVVTIRKTKCYPKNVDQKINYYNAIVNSPVTNSKGGIKLSLQSLSLAFILINAPLGILILKLFQMFDFLKLINVDLPLNVIEFLKWFEDNMFDLIPNFMKTNDIGIGCNPHFKLLESKFSCLVVNNTGTIVQENGIYIFSKLVVLMTTFVWRMFRKTDKNKVKDKDR